MRKLVYVILSCLLLLGVLSLLPFINGYLFQQRYLETLAGLQEMQRTHLSVVDYQRGWFTSEVKTQINYTAKNSQPINVTFQQHITHGPILFDPINNHWTFAQAKLEGRFYLPEFINLQLFGNAMNKEIFHIKSVAKFGGDYIGQLVSTPLNITLPRNQGRIIWEGMKADSYIFAEGTDIKNLKATVNTGAASFNSAMGSVAIQNAVIQYNLNRGDLNLWSGSYSFSLPGLNVNSGNQNVSLENFLVSDNFTANQDFYNNEFQTSIARLVIPDFSVEPSTLNISMNNFSSRGLSNLISALSHMNKSQMTKEQAQQLQVLIPGLFTPTAIIKQNVSVNTSFGKFLSEGQIYWPGNIKTLEDVSNTTTFNISVRAAVPLVNKIIEMTSPRRDYEATTPLASDPPKSLTPEEKMTASIDTLIQQNKLSVSVGLQLKDLIKSKIPPEAFAANLDEFVLKKDIKGFDAAMLKLDYSKMYADSQNSTVPQPVPPPIAQQVSPLEQNKKMLDDLVKQGYIKLENNDYVTIITREQGVIKVNGLPMPVPG